MRLSVLAAFLATAAFASVPMVPAARAGSGIQRCEASSGEAIYTDKACATFDARAVPMSGELLVRLAHEQTRAPEGASTMADDIVAPAPGPSRRSVAAGCARTPTQLAMDLRGAFALGDVNRIAESYHWVGMSHAGAMAVMDRLEQLQRNTLVDTHYFDATIGIGIGLAAYADAGAAPVDGGTGILQATFSDDGRVASITDFEVLRHAGCYFVRF